MTFKRKHPLGKGDTINLDHPDETEKEERGAK